MASNGGLIPERTLPDGSKRPYEINISLFDALETEEKFLCAHAILLSLEGIPAFYIQSLLGIRNDLERVSETERVLLAQCVEQSATHLGCQYQFGCH
ncbi:MAG: hypothetical protein ACKVKH_16725 [Verrucomicrobiales bacterium]